MWYSPFHLTLFAIILPSGSFAIWLVDKIRYSQVFMYYLNHSFIPGTKYSPTAFKRHRETTWTHSFSPWSTGSKWGWEKCAQPWQPESRVRREGPGTGITSPTRDHLQLGPLPRAHSLTGLIHRWAHWWVPHAVIQWLSTLKGRLGWCFQSNP